MLEILINVWTVKFVRCVDVAVPRFKNSLLSYWEQLSKSSAKNST